MGDKDAMIDTWLRFGFTEKDEPGEIINQMQNDVGNFTKEIIREGSSVVILEGRKASFMIHHMKPRLEEEGFVFQRLQYNRLDNSYSYFTRIKSESPTIVITDSIHRGRKMSGSLAYLKENEVEIKTVYSYLSAKNGLNKVEETGLIRRDDIYSHHFADNEKEYRLKSGGLHTYFNSRIEPMETETPYDLYRIEPKVSRTKMRAILREAIRSSVESVVIKQSSSNSRMPRDVWKVGFNIRNKDLKKLLSRVSSEILAPFTLNYFYVHFKIREKNNSADFTVIPEIDLQSEVVRKDDKITCPMTKENVCLILGPQKQNNRVLLCSACLGNIAAYTFMIGFEIQISKILAKENIKYKLDYRFIPLQEKLEHLRKELISE